MRIGYDGKRAVANNTGLGNYSRLVLESVAMRYPADTLTVLSSSRRDNSRLATLRELDNVSFVYPPKSIIPGYATLWRSYGITDELRKLGIDLYHGLSNELPLNIAKACIPAVLTMHDVIYRRHPEYYRPFDRMMCDYKYGRSCRNATRIIAISERTKLDIMEYYGVAPDKIDIVYQGCDSSFRTRHTAEQIECVKQRYNLPERYILQVGTIEPRKNAELTVRALSAVDSDIKLVLVGRDNHYKAYLDSIAAESGVGNRIVYVHNVSFADLPAVNQGAEVIVYPSHYEGFGIPVLEALESRRPVIAATGSCLEEAGGPSSIYIDPHNPRAMAEAINAVISGEADCDKMVAEGLRHASRFDNSDIADAIMAVYNRAIEDFKRQTAHQ